MQSAIAPSAAGRALRGLLSIALAVLLASCGGAGTQPWSFADVLPKSGPEAVAKLTPKNGSSVSGTVSFVQRGGKVAVVADLHELASGPHSMYIHEVGNCSSPNAASAGKVWELIGAAPGRPRIGNLPEVVAGTEGNASAMESLTGVTVGDGSPLDVVGRSVVIHSGLDPNPRPEFGVRNGWLACGVIERQ